MMLDMQQTMAEMLKKSQEREEALVEERTAATAELHRECLRQDKVRHSERKSATKNDSIEKRRNTSDERREKQSRHSPQWQQCHQTVMWLTIWTYLSARWRRGRFPRTAGELI